MRIKKIALALLLALCMFMFCACGGDTILTESSTNNSFSMSYSKFNSSRDVNFTLGEEKNIRVMVITNKGKLNMEIFKTADDGSAKTWYTGEDIQTGNHDVRLEAGRYNIKVNGENHSGGFTITY